MLKSIITYIIGEINNEVSHVEFNARKTEQLPFFNEWSKIIFNKSL